MAKIIFFGTPEYVLPVPQALKEAGYEIVAVVTQPAKPVGRNKILTPSPTETWAKENNIPVVTDSTLLHRSVEFKADLGIVASYGKIISNEVLEQFPHGMLNVHPSLLPKYRGACPIQNAILDGEIESGVTIIKMDEKMDHGPIVIQKRIKIKATDTFESLLKSSFQLGAELLIKVVPEYLEGKIKLVPQNEEEATYTWKTNETKAAAYFDLENPPSPEVLDRMARAFYPWPNAWTKWNGKIVKLYPNKVIQIEGKKPVGFEQFKRGYPSFPLLED